MSKHQIIQKLEQKRMKQNLPDFCVGDTVRVDLRLVEEGGKERIQAFSGIVIAQNGSGLSQTFSLRRVAYGEGMERVFYLHSPLIANIVIERRGEVRRSKLYYLRGKSGKAAKVKARFGVASTRENNVEAAATAE